MQKIKDAIKNIIYKLVTPQVNSYSQAGEDRVLNFLFIQKGITKLSYLDIGICTPDDDSNTYLFYKKGSKGVLVEANQAMIPYIKKIRPKDIVLNVGVSVDHQTEADFYIFSNPCINTFDKVEAISREAHGSFKIIQTVKVPLFTINEIIEKHFNTYPDFLSLDIEGLDMEVLKTLSYPVPVICAETSSYSENHVRPKIPGFHELMASKGYFIYADTYLNTIYVHRDWFYNRN